MIEEGWIFPDGNEYEIGGLDIHTNPVQRFVEGLQFQNKKLYEQIDAEIEEIFFKHRDPYTHYAITRLGWIKVGTAGLPYITIAGYDWQYDLVAPYEKNGFSISDMCCSPKNYLELKCNILRAIRQGYESASSTHNEYYSTSDIDER